MSAHVQLHQAGVLTGRQMVMAVTIGLHVLAIMALMATRVIVGPGEERRLLADFLPPDPVPIDLAPSLPGFDDTMLDVIRPRRVTATVPVVVPSYYEEAGNTAPTAATEGAELPPAGNPNQSATGEGAHIAPTALQFRAVRPADDYYPSESRTLNEEGVAIVKVCVAPTGRLDGRPIIDRSSGSPRLDRAAVTWAREALRFTPATENGVPVAACKGFRVNFTLH